jgi:hypothetical protein
LFARRCSRRVVCHQAYVVLRAGSRSIQGDAYGSTMVTSPAELGAQEGGTATRQITDGGRGGGGTT